MADNDLPSYLPPPTQFLQEEASEDDYGEEEEDEEFEQPLLQIKMNGRAARSNAQQGFSIPSSSFYGRSDELDAGIAGLCTTKFLVGRVQRTIGGEKKIHFFRGLSTLALDSCQLQYVVSQQLRCGACQCEPVWLAHVVSIDFWCATRGAFFGVCAPSGFGSLMRAITILHSKRL
ncbi:unnamed protein product [Toxocara canis]|uniref:Uncharacterized protein n=1 Tax=Toxocara canis TaxID=6265 RepID=A0A183UQK9_TOXCA|nr:unnamed protein product [Toxocara canis]